MRSISEKNHKFGKIQIFFISSVSIQAMSNEYFYEILDHGSVELLDSMASDLDVVNAAKVSFAARKDEIDESCIGLINYLMKNKHATPFEHSVFKFHVKAPIFVTREWMRHRWSSFNEMSMRYHKPDQIDYYVPSIENIRKQIGKPGAYTFEQIEDQKVINEFYLTIQNTINMANWGYHSLVDIGVAKEIARCVLPVTQYTEFIWTVNARSLINFISLRNDSNAQYEINEYAVAIEDVFAKKMPITYEAFVTSGRVAI
jgi:thymidylate synthase (FAD)